VWQHPINQQDEIKRAYIKMGPYQRKLAEFQGLNQGGSIDDFNTLGLINFLG
jgi:hypothetical protein